MVVKKPKAAPAARPPSDAPDEQHQTQVNDTQDGAPTPNWGAFSTDTASGQAPESQGEQQTQGEQQQMPAEDTEAAKVKTARAKKASKAPPAADEGGGINTTKLVKFVERIERLNEELGTMKEDIKEIFIEVKAAGYKSAIVRKVLARRAMDPEKLKELDSLVDLYEEALR